VSAIALELFRHFRNRTLPRPVWKFFWAPSSFKTLSRMGKTNPPRSRVLHPPLTGPLAVNSATPLFLVFFPHHSLAGTVAVWFGAFSSGIEQKSPSADAFDFAPPFNRGLDAQLARQQTLRTFQPRHTGLISFWRHPRCPPASSAPSTILLRRDKLKLSGSATVSSRGPAPGFLRFLIPWVVLPNRVFGGARRKSPECLH